MTSLPHALSPEVAWHALEVYLEPYSNSYAVKRVEVQHATDARHGGGYL